MISKKETEVYKEKPRILLRANEFLCLLPHPCLSRYISNYNITFPTKDILPDRFTELPNGCATLTVENDGKNLWVHLDGPLTKPCIVGNRANRLAMMVTIEFKPAGLYALTGVNQWELTNASASLAAIAPKLSKLISNAVEASKSVCELVESLDKLLMGNMAAAFQPQFLPALQYMQACSGDISVKALSGQVYYSERHLNRIFRQHVGIGAKSFSRLLRVNNAFRLLKKADTGITLVSDRMGFHDLSHFMRDFRSVCGITPQEYRENMSDFYINTMKL